MDLRVQQAEETPTNLASFDTLDPNTGGTVFDPASLAGDTDTLFASSIDGSTWIYKGGSYVTKTYTIPDNTPFNLYGTSVDAGGNKTSFIERNGPILVNSVAANGTRYAGYFYSRTTSGMGRGLIVRKDLRTTSGDYLTVQGWNSSTGDIENKLNVEHDGSLLINDAYTLPNADGTADQVLKTDGLGGATFVNPSSLVKIQSVVSSTTVTPTSNDDLVEITAQAEALTIANPTGTFADGQSGLVRVYDNGTARGITYGSKYRTLGDTLPATTVVGEWTYIGYTYNATDDKFDCIANSGNTTGSQPCEIQLACSDETTALTTGTAKTTFRMPYAMTVTEVRASLSTAGSTSGTTTIDINEGGVSILSTLLTIDFGDKTSVGATTPAVISDSALADDAEITFDIDAISGGATEAGLKVTLIGTRA